MTLAVSNRESLEARSIFPEEEAKGKDSSGRCIEELSYAGINGYEKGAISSVTITALLFFAAIACLVAAIFLPAVSIPLFLSSLALGTGALLLTPLNIILSAKA